MSSPDPRFERAVLDAFRQAVERYCTIVRSPGPPRISVTVVTSTPMGREFPGKVHRIVHQQVDDRLPQARVHPVVFTVDAALPGPGHHFLIQPPAAGPAPNLPMTRTEPRPAALPPIVRLTLRYGADFRWACHLASAPGWVPLGRWSHRRPDAAVRLPEYATFLPRGELLYLRHLGDRVEFTRSSLRPDYLVSIDGAALRSGGRLIQAGPAGSIEYADGAPSSTRLDYHLAWEGGHG